MTQLLKVNFARRVTLDVVTRGRILLVTGHAGDRVIQDDYGGIALIVRNICKAGHTGMHESGIADDSDRLILALLAEGLVKAVDGADGSAHAQGHIHGAQRSNRTQSIASDISQNGDIVLLQGVKQTSVRTSGAHNGGSDGQGLIQSDKLCALAGQLLGNHVLGVFSLHGEDILAGHLEPKCLAVVFDNRV